MSATLTGFSIGGMAVKSIQADGRAVLESLTIDEISGVDAPAQEGALAKIAKGMKPAKATKGVARVVLATAKGAPTASRKSIQLTSVDDGHQHSVDASSEDQSGCLGYSSAVGEEHGHSHDWVRNEDGSVSVALVNGHTHTFPADAEALEVEPVAAAAPVTPPATEKNAMDPIKMQAELDAMKAKIAELEAACAAATKVADLPVAEQKFAKRLDGAARLAFIAKSDADRAALAAPIYKAADGTEYVAGEDKLADLAKRADAAEDKSAMVELTKRAESELARLPSTIVEKAAALRDLAKLPEVSRLVIEKMLAAGNAGLADMFKAKGVGGATSVDGSSALEKIESIAKAHADKNGVSIEAARAAVYETSEGKRLYAEYRAGR